MPEKNWKSARTRAAIARLPRTASTVVRIVRALPGDRPSPATAVTRNVRLPRIDGRFAECSVDWMLCSFDQSCQNQYQMGCYMQVAKGQKTGGQLERT